jgi:hypothetical protein
LLLVSGFSLAACARQGAKSLRAQSDGKVLITDGPYLETKEHIGGFWVIEIANMDEAVAWARKGVLACRVAGRGAGRLAARRQPEWRGRECRVPENR